MRKLNPRNLTAALAVAFSVALQATAQKDDQSPTYVLISNVNIFIGE